jgi:PAS domain S-box-containing protein
LDADGKVVGSSVAIMDITQLVKIEQALKQSEDNYRQLFSSIFEGFALHEMIYDQNGAPVDYRFLEINPAFEELTGLKAADILGKTVLEVLPETEPYWIQTYAEVVRSGSAVRFENYHHSLDKYFEVIAFRPRENQFGVIFTDISGRRQAG